MEPSIDDWLSWAKDSGISQEIWDFINQNHAHLEHDSEFEPNKVYPSRRSWERLNECLTKADLIGESSSVLFTLTSAFVGFEAAVAFNDFIQNYDRQVTIEDILIDGKIEKVADFGINDHNALIEKIESSGVLSDVLPKEQVDNLARYFVTLPSEVAMKLWSALGGGALENTLSLHQSDVEGSSVSDYLVKILATDD